MLIFVFPAVYPNDNNKNAGIFILEHCQALERAGHQVIVLDASSYNYRRWHKKNCWRCESMASEFGTGYVWHTFGFMSSRLPRLQEWQTRKKLFYLYTLACRKFGKPDLLLGHFTYPAGAIATEIGKKESIPTSVIEHYSLYLQKKLHPFLQRELKQTVEFADTFICVSNSLLASVERWVGSHDIHVIPNLISNRFQFSPPPPLTPFTFFSAGNLVKSKNFDLLINAFCLAFDEKETVQLIIAGAGPEKDSLLQCVSSNGRVHQISLAGSLTREEMVSAYSKSHCFALPSLYETFGIVYREAMCSGRPVISTQNGGVEENWEDRFGILSGASPEELSVCLKRMKTDYELYDLKYIAQKNFSLYNEKIVLQNFFSTLPLNEQSK